MKRHLYLKIQKSFAVITAVLFLCPSFLGAQELKRAISHVKTSDTVVPVLQDVPFQTAIERMTNINRKLKNGEPLTQWDTSSAHFSLWVLGQHMHAAHAYDQLDATVANLTGANKYAVVNRVITTDDVQKVHGVFQKFGLNYTEEDVWGMLQKRPDERSAFIGEYLKKGGIAAEHRAMLSRFAKLHWRVAARSTRLGGSLRGASFKLRMAAAKPGGDNPCTHMELVAAMFGLLCAVSEGAALPACYAAAVAAVEATACREMEDHQAALGNDSDLVAMFDDPWVSIDPYDGGIIGEYDYNMPPNASHEYDD